MQKVVAVCDTFLSGLYGLDNDSIEGRSRYLQVSVALCTPLK